MKKFDLFMRLLATVMLVFSGYEGYLKNFSEATYYLVLALGLMNWSKEND